MNEIELRAILIIAQKMNWMQNPMWETVEAIKQMVGNQQALELDAVGECYGDEETLLSIALWGAEKIASTMYVRDCFSLANWNCYCNYGWEGLTFEDFCDMMHWDAVKAELLAAEYEEEEIIKEEALDDDYYLACMRDVAWINKHC